MKTGTIEDLFDRKAVDFTVNGKCSGCGSCCSNILPVSDAEVKRIREYICTHDIKEQKKLWAAPDAMDMTCPFRDDVNRKCTIYEVRPAICRVYKCDNDAKGIHPKELRIQKDVDGIVLMRGTFFGNKDDLAIYEAVEKRGNGG